MLYIVESLSNNNTHVKFPGLKLISNNTLPNNHPPSANVYVINQILDPRLKTQDVRNPVTIHTSLPK
jgi:hypothetical protein